MQNFLLCDLNKQHGCTLFKLAANTQIMICRSVHEKCEKSNTIYQPKNLIFPPNTMHEFQFIITKKGKKTCFKYKLRSFSHLALLLHYLKFVN